MTRLIGFTVICGIYTYLAWRISRWLGYAFDEVSFGAAIAVAALTGFTWFLVSDWWSAMTKPFHPQTVKMETKDTPFQIGCNALWAIVQLCFFIALAIIFVIMVIRMS